MVKLGLHPDTHNHGPHRRARSGAPIFTGASSGNTVSFPSRTAAALPHVPGFPSPKYYGPRGPDKGGVNPKNNNRSACSATSKMHSKIWNALSAFRIRSRTTTRRAPAARVEVGIAARVARRSPPLRHPAPPANSTTACRQAWMCTGHSPRHASEPVVAYLIGLHKGGDVDPSRRWCGQLVEAAGSVVGLRYGTGARTTPCSGEPVPPQWHACGHIRGRRNNRANLVLFITMAPTPIGLRSRPSEFSSEASDSGVDDEGELRDDPGRNRVAHLDLSGQRTGPRGSRARRDHPS